ncbi:MAG: ComEC/Rec2 family competence protein [Chthoniobacterales bacterium]|nr:ComEC/Rec2 family competence protein [Chthoniobacterales bacterium]
MSATEHWPRQPFIGLGLAAVAGILLADFMPLPELGWIAVASTAIAALVRKSSGRTVLFVASSFFALHATRQTGSPGVQLAEFLGHEPLALVARGQVVSGPKISPRGSASFHLRLREIERDGTRSPTDANLFVRWGGDVQYGDELQLFGVAQPFSPPRNPGEFDMRRYLARRDVHHTLVVRYAENGRVLARTGGNPIMRAAQATSGWMQQSLSRGLEDAPHLQALISAMVLGLREATPDEMEESFQQTGTLHLFAVSGLHVGIIGFLLWIILTVARVPRKWAAAFIIPALFFYAAVTGLNTSSVRAAIMAAVLLGGVFAERKVFAANSVAAAAVLILAADTNQLFATGFQLSFAVVITIVLIANPLRDFFVSWCEPDPFLPRALLGRVQKLGLGAWEAITRGASVSLAAWIGSVPLILPYFYLVTPIALFANLLVVPIAFCVLAVGVMSLLLTPLLPALALVLNNANWTLATTLLAVVELFARAPAGHLYLEPRLPDRATFELTVLDLGAGAAVHARTRGKDWLLDCGAERDFKFTVRAYLRSRGINRLDGLLLTHGDSAHVGGAVPIARTFRPRLVVDNAAPSRSPLHQRFLAYANETQLTVQARAAPDEFLLSRDVAARVLFPPPGFAGRAADDQAMVVQLIIANQWRVLLVSDIGEAAERMLLESNVDLASHVMIKGQHHTGPPGTAEFLQRVRPQLVVAAVPIYADRGRLLEDWAEMVRAQGVHLFRQDRSGAVTLRFQEQRWQATSYITSETFRSSTR